MHDFFTQLADIANLLAAILCTLGSGVGTAALIMSGVSLIARLSALGAALGTAGGLVWIIAAIAALF
jgi:hypothetical protein